MNASLGTTCPVCLAEIGDDERICPSCGVIVGSLPPLERYGAPLILPGSTGLRADDVRAKPPVVRIALVTLATAAVLGIVISRMPDAPGDPLPPGFSAPVARDPDAPSAAPSTLPASAAVPAVIVASGDSVTADSAAGFATSDLSLAAGDVASQPVPATAAPAIEPSAVAPTAVVPSAVVASAAAPSGAARVAGSVAGTAMRRGASDGTAAVARAEPRAVVARTIAPPAPTRGPTPRPTPAPTASPTSARSAPSQPASVLILATPVTGRLRPGDRMQLRWTVRRRAGGRAPDPVVLFSSSDPRVASVGARTGAVIALAPGTASIFADGGAAGFETVEIAVAAPPTVPTVASSPVPRVTVPPSPVAVGPPSAAAPASTAPAATTAATTSPAAPRDAPATPLPDAADVRGIAASFVSDVRNRTVRNPELAGFFSEGADHRVALVADPVISSVGLSTVRVTFSLRLSRYDAAGRPVTRIAQVSMIVDKRNNVLNSSAVDVAPLRRP